MVRIVSTKKIQKLFHFIHEHHSVVFSFMLLVVTLFVFKSFTLPPIQAAPPASPYGPGDSLDPSCTPGSANCTVFLGWDVDTVSNFVYNNGYNVGIGTATPDADLHVNGTFKLVDGNEGSGKVLTSDANGLSTWQTPSGGGGGGISYGGSVGGGNPNEVLYIDPSGNLSSDADFTRNITSGEFHVQGEITPGFDSSANVGTLFSGSFFGGIQSAYLEHTDNSTGSSFVYAGDGTNVGQGSLAAGIGYFDPSFSDQAVGFFHKDGIAFQMQSTTGNSVGSSLSMDPSSFSLDFGDSTINTHGSLSMNSSSSFMRFDDNTSGSVSRSDFDSSQAALSYADSSGSTSIVVDSLNDSKGITFSFPSLGTLYSFPVDAGTSGYVLTTDGVNTLSWAPDNTGGGGFNPELYDESPSTPTPPNATGTNAVAIGDGTTAVGLNSTALGYNSDADGDYATVFGRNNLASGQGATAFGDSTTASGIDTTTFGSGTQAIGDYATALGYQTVASGTYSLVSGYLAAASGLYSTALGNATTAGNDYATAFGAGSMATGNTSTAFGGGTVASGTTSTAFGDSATALGITATAFGSHTNATVDYATAFGYFTTASGLTSTAFGSGTTASGDYSVAFGSNTLASVLNSTAFGTSTTASGVNSTAFGTSTIASGLNSTAFGSSGQAAGDYATSFGANTLAPGVQSTAFGDSTSALSYDEIALGAFNTDTYTPVSTTAWSSTDRLLVIGNGQTGARSDAFTILKNGHVAIGIDDFGTPANDGGYMLQVEQPAADVGTTTIVARFKDGNNNTCDIDPTFGSVVCTSDENFKKDITHIDNALNTVLALRGVTYHWKAEGDDEPVRIGFIAQEVEKILPNIVATDSQTGRKSVAYTNVIPYLVEAIKQLNDKVDLLASGITVGSQAGEVIVKKLTTHELCLDDVCITKDELQTILENNDISTDAGSNETPEDTSGDTSQGTDDSSENDSGDGSGDSSDGTSEETTSDDMLDETPADTSDESSQDSSDDASSGDVGSGENSGGSSEGNV